MIKLMRLPALMIALAVQTAAVAAADDVAQFYRGRTVYIITSTGVGGPYDRGARALARHMPSHLPGNPTMVVQNMPGGGHLLATNHLYNVAPRDGSVIGTVNGTIPVHQVVDGTGVRFDVAKFNWLGSVSSTNLLTIVTARSGIKSFEDLKTRETIAGATGIGSMAAFYPIIMNNMLKTKFRIVPGYKSAGELDLAIESGEIESRSGTTYESIVAERPQWLKDHTIRPIVQIGRVRNKELPDVPLLQELVSTPEEKAVLRLLSGSIIVGRPLLAPPGVPAERVAALRQAFDATMKDQAFLDECARTGVDLDPVDSTILEAAIRDIVSQPPELVEQAKKMIQTN
jgi:tripartite-type tricarboxylate transporter receptor subunit TctC